MLLPDRQGDLRKQPAELDSHDAPDQLVAPADLPKIYTPRFDVPVVQLFGKQAVDLALRHAMMPAGRLHRLDLSVVDPLLQCRVADAEDVGGFPRRQELLHDRPPANLQNTVFVTVTSIRFYTGPSDPSSATVCRFSGCERCAPGFSFRHRGRRRLRVRDQGYIVR